LYTFFISFMSATFPAYLIVLDLITLKIYGEEYKLWHSLCNFLQPLVTYSLIGPNILLSIPLLTTPNLCSCIKVSDQVSHTYKVGKIMALYILICTVRRQEDKNIMNWMVASIHQM
jgi:hypothetical protein